MGQTIGAILAIMIGMMAIPQLLGFSRTGNQNMVASSVAQQAIQFNTAVTGYTQTYATQIEAVATATQPAVITVTMLKNTKFLPAEFHETTGEGNKFEAQILQPVPGTLQALAVTTGGNPLPDNRLTKIANLIGHNGGYIPLNDTNRFTANTAYGTGWGPLPTTNYNVEKGALASMISIANGQLVDNRLYRNAIPGQPQLNAMNVPIIMNSIQLLNDACANIGAIARNVEGRLLSCMANGWQLQTSFWLDPVIMFSALPTDDPVGAVRISTDTGRAYMWTGTKWSALAVDQSGDILIPGTATIKALKGDLQVAATAAENTACVGEGRIASSTTTSGLILSCQSGLWAQSTGKKRYQCFHIAGFEYKPEYVGTFDYVPAAGQYGYCAVSGDNSWVQFGITSDRNGVQGCYCFRPQ